MADNVTLNPGIGGNVVAADEIGGVQYQRIKLIQGNDGINDGDVSVSNPLPVMLDDVALAALENINVTVLNPTTSVEITNDVGNSIPVSGPLTKTQLDLSNVKINLADGPQLSAFGKLNITSTHSAFDCQNEYGLDTLRLWDVTANGVLGTKSTNGSVSSAGNSVGPTDINSRITPITVSSTPDHYAILQSRQYVRYIPGKGSTSFITGVMSPNSNSAASFVWRTSSSGGITEIIAQQSDWSEDTFSNSARNPSGITLDFTKIQILVIDAQMLYAGRIRVGFDIDGVLYWAHYFKIANNFILPTMQTYNLPVRVEGRTFVASTIFNFGRFDKDNGIMFRTTSSVLGGTVSYECCSVQNNGEDELRGFPQSVSRGINTVSVSTRRPVLSIRPAATFNSRINRAHIVNIESEINAGSGSCYWELVVDGTLGGASWVGITNSVTEYDISATTITGGGTILSGFVSGGSASARESSTGGSELRNPQVLSKIDDLVASQIPFSIVCTSFTGSTTITASFNWHEKTI